MIGQFLKAVGQLDDPRVRGVILGSLVATLLLFFLVGVAVVTGLGFLELTGVPAFEWLIELLGAAAVVLLAWFAFPAFMGVIASLFLERVVDAVEHRHYPGLPAPRNLGVSTSIVMATRFAGVVLLVNLVALPFYAIFLFFPVLSFALFICVNGYLLGREYFELVAARRMDQTGFRALFRANRATLFLAGIVVALLTTVPIINLLAPVVATAFITHVFHGLYAQAPAHA